MQKEPQPYRLAVAEAALADLKERLGRTRWPDEPPAALAQDVRAFFAALR